jgi:hypothetical protein
MKGFYFRDNNNSALGADLTEFVKKNLDDVVTPRLPIGSSPWTVMLLFGYDIKTNKPRGWEVRIHSSPRAIFYMRNYAHLNTIFNSLANLKLPEDLPKILESKKDECSYYWFVLAYIDRIEDPKLLIDLWYAWNNAKARGITSRLQFGSELYLKMINSDKYRTNAFRFRCLNVAPEYIKTTAVRLLIDLVKDFESNYH